MSTEVVVKTFTVTIETPDGALPPALVSIPDVPLRLTDLIEPAQNLCSGVVTLAIDRAAANGRALSCAKGCGVCCCQLVPLSAPEAAYIVERLQAGDPAKCERVHARFADLKRKLAETGMQERFERLEESREDTAVAKDYFHLGIPCPFLKENSCSIHPWRPLICRQYNVTSPSSWCADPFSHDIQRIKLARSMPTAMARLSSALLEIPASLIPMPLMFDWHAQNRHLLEMRWRGIELFDLMLQFALGQKPPPPSDW